MCIKLDSAKLVASIPQLRKSYEIQCLYSICNVLVFACCLCIIAAANIWFSVDFHFGFSGMYNVGNRIACKYERNIQTLNNWKSLFLYFEFAYWYVHSSLVSCIYCLIQTRSQETNRQTYETQAKHRSERRRSSSASVPSFRSTRTVDHVAEGRHRHWSRRQTQYQVDNNKVNK
jgi:hypothetical protein